MQNFTVTITANDTDELGTFVVAAADEWKARTRAMGSLLMSDRADSLVSGSPVDYTVTPVAEGHYFERPMEDGPEICRCGAAFYDGFNLQAVKMAHLAAF